MKRLSLVVVVVVSLSLAKHRRSDEVDLIAWPQGQHFYLGEPIVLTCGVEKNSSEVWIYSWFRHNHSKAVIPSPAHRVYGHIYSISALTLEDTGTYWCRAQKQGTNSSFLSNSVSLSVTAASPPGSLDIFPDSSQHLQGAQFSLRCSLHGNWTLWQLHGAELISDCLKMGGRINPNRSDTCSFNNISGRLSGLYWCGNDRRSKTINITVSENSEEENNFIAAWVWVICVIVIILLLIPVTFLVVPSLRKRIKLLSTHGEFNALQEMPRTKQDVTEIQWDLAWMEMTNLLDKPCPSS